MFGLIRRAIVVIQIRPGRTDMVFLEFDWNIRPGHDIDIWDTLLLLREFHRYLGQIFMGPLYRQFFLATWVTIGPLPPAEVQLIAIMIIINEFVKGVSNFFIKSPRDTCEVSN